MHDGQQAESGIIFRSSLAVIIECLLEKKNHSDNIYLRAVNQAGHFDKYSQNIQNMYKNVYKMYRTNISTMYIRLLSVLYYANTTESP